MSQTVWLRNGLGVSVAILHLLLVILDAMTSQAPLIVSLGWLDRVASRVEPHRASTVRGAEYCSPERSTFSRLLVPNSFDRFRDYTQSRDITSAVLWGTHVDRIPSTAIRAVV